MTTRTRAAILLRCLTAASCARAPSFDILGSYFPAWLVCLATAVLLSVFVRWVLMRLRVDVVIPTVLYPTLVAIFTFTQWLIFLR